MNGRERRLILGLLAYVSATRMEKDDSNLPEKKKL